MIKESIPNCVKCKWSGNKTESVKVPWFDRFETKYIPICEAQGGKEKINAYLSSSCVKLYKEK